MACSTDMLTFLNGQHWEVNLVISFLRNVVDVGDAYLPYWSQELCCGKPMLLIIYAVFMQEKKQSYSTKRLMLDDKFLINGWYITKFHKYNLTGVKFRQRQIRTGCINRIISKRGGVGSTSRGDAVS